MNPCKLAVLFALLFCSTMSAAQTEQARLRSYCNQEYERDSDAKDLSCQAMKAVEGKAHKCLGSPVQNLYSLLVERLRKQTIDRLMSESSRKDYYQASYYEAGDQSDGLHTGDETPEAFTDRMKSSNLKELECLGKPELASKLAELLDAVTQQSKVLRAKEVKCRKDKKCMAHREDLVAGDSICDTIASIKLAQDQMKAERANPSGVVNLATLHELGQVIQTSQYELKRQKAEFQQAHKRAFPESVCREIWARPQ